MIRFGEKTRSGKEAEDDEEEEAKLGIDSSAIARKKAGAWILREKKGRDLVYFGFDLIGFACKMTTSFGCAKTLVHVARCRSLALVIFFLRNKQLFV